MSPHDKVQTFQLPWSFRRFMAHSNSEAGSTAVTCTQTGRPLRAVNCPLASTGAALGERNML